MGDLRLFDYSGTSYPEAGVLFIADVTIVLCLFLTLPIWGLVWLLGWFVKGGLNE